MSTDSDQNPTVGTTATDRDGEVLGTVSAVWLDDASGRATWVGLTAGAHASPTGDDAVVVVPLDGARTTPDRLQLAVEARVAREAPRLGATQRLTPEDELRLRAHYARTAGTTDPTPAAAPSEPAGATGTMTRSEERLTVQTTVEPWGRAVLRVETVTEEVMVPVRVTRQRARIEHLPLATTGGPTAAAPSADGQASEWVTLWGEQPVVTVERVPVERVRLRTGWVSEDRVVSDRLAHEELTVETTGEASPTR